MILKSYRDKIAFFLIIPLINSLCLLRGSEAFSQACNIEKIKKNILELSSEPWKGRPAELNTARLFAKFLHSELEGLKFNHHKFRYPWKNQNIRAINFYLYPRKSSPCILLMAHYDHIGSESFKSKEVGRNCLHPGADDNASGVVLLISVYDSLRNLGLNSNEVAVVFFSAHERGLWGSYYFSNLKKVRKWSPQLIINLDMVGRLDLNSKTLRVEHTNLSLPFSCDSLNVISESLHSKGDHSHFKNLNSQVIFLTTGLHDDYHKCSDTPEKINFYGLCTIRNCLIKFILEYIFFKK